MASAAAELLGGNGYIEEWPVARFLRDALGLPEPDLAEPDLADPA